MFDVKTAVAARQSRTQRLRCGVLVRSGSAWVGAHYSEHDRRWCINLLPFVTFWIALPGGLVPRGQHGH